MARGQLIRIELECPKCGKKAYAILMENEQGMCKVNTYLCADDLNEMKRDIPNADSEQSGDASKVD